MSKKIVVGKFSSAFGIVGQLKIISYCEDPAKIEKYKLFDEDEKEIVIKISNKNKSQIGSTSDGSAVLIAKVEGITNRNDAEKLRGKEIFTNRSEFKNLKKDEFYYSDLIGLDVIEEGAGKVGEIINVSNFGAGGVVEIQFLESKKVENFSFTNSNFPEVNLEKGFVKFINNNEE